jgi:3-oxoacyl-[acyl-carrier protein] reductase
MDLGLKGRRALVCGGSKGIGRAAAHALAREGVAVTLVARSPEPLADAAAAIAGDTGAPVDWLAADLASAGGRAAALAACAAIDILVTNPGVRPTPASWSSRDRAAWDQWLEAHFFSALELIRAAAPGMCARKFGRIVNISVSFIKFPQVGFGHSHAARLALAGAIAAMARELVPHNVTVNSVLPGLIDTEALQTNLHAHAARGGTTYEAIVADRLRSCPAGRFAAPSEIGDLIAMLCAAQMGFMTAQNIVSDGGVHQGLF